MKARCIKLLDSLGNPQERSPWLTLNGIYHVLAVEMDVNGVWLLRMVGDGPNGVALFRLCQFEIISQRIPPSWIVSWRNNGLFELAPDAWIQPAFWEKYYDLDPEARSTFEEEKKKIVDFDP